MKTEQEILGEISELFGANEALGVAMEAIHEQRKDVLKKMLALRSMLDEMRAGKDGE
jgi:hypothetical protein